MALLLALLMLVLISGVAAAMMVLSGTESALVLSQRTSIRALYAAQAGLEEVRGRLWDGHPQAFSKLVPAVALPSSVGQVLYILNPAPGEVVDPTNLASPFGDTDYQQEFGTALALATVNTIATAQPTSGATPTIPYKWVRITVKTEQAANADINLDGVIDGTIPIFYNGRENLNGQGNRVYRLTSLAAPLNGSRKMLQEDVYPVPGGFRYALAAGNACELTIGAAMTIDGNVRCNSEITVNGPLTMLNGGVEGYGSITGSGAISLQADNQVHANGAVDNVVTGGASPNVVSAPGTVLQLATPATPTPPPLAPNTIPNPNAVNITSSNQVVNPPGTCAGGVLTFDLGNVSPPMLFVFDTTQPVPPSWAACGGGSIPSNFPSNVSFAGVGALYFAQNSSIDFHNNFGTAAVPLSLNIIARPKDNSVGQDTMSFFGNVYINGLIYSHGEIYTKCPSANFFVRGSVIPYKDPAQLGPTNNGDFGLGSCTTGFSLTYDPTQFTANLPPGFNTLLTGGGSDRVAILSFRERN